MNRILLLGGVICAVALSSNGASARQQHPLKVLLGRLERGSQGTLPPQLLAAFLSALESSNANPPSH